MLQTALPLYICKVCGKQYSDTWDHVLHSTGQGFLYFKDQAHQRYGKAIEDSIEPEICFCGGPVTTIGIGECGWDRSCRDCGMLYDED